MTVLSIIFLVVGTALFCIGAYLYLHAQKRDSETVHANQQLKLEYQSLNNSNQIAKKNLKEIQQQILKAYEEAEEIKNLLLNGYKQFCNTLDNTYTLKEQDFDREINKLVEDAAIRKQQIALSILQVQNELEKIQQTRFAAIEAQKREEAIQQAESFYKININEIDLNTIKLINELKPRLPDARVLCMLIWQTFYQKKMNELCANVLGMKIRCGIYKITNLKTKMTYIGQSVNIADRWKTHAKCGLGIDVPARNKLYQAMQIDGLENFTFELLEECDKNLLDEKERFYINLYQSYDYGYNSTIGNK